MATEEEKIEELSDLLESVPPKRVRTEDYEIEAHDPLKIQKAMERRSATYPTLSSIPFTKVVPKDGCNCPNSKWKRCPES